MPQFDLPTIFNCAFELGDLIITPPELGDVTTGPPRGIRFIKLAVDRLKSTLSPTNETSKRDRVQSILISGHLFEARKALTSMVFAIDLWDDAVRKMLSGEKMFPKLDSIKHSPMVDLVHATRELWRCMSEYERNQVSEDVLTRARRIWEWPFERKVADSTNGDPAAFVPAKDLLDDDQFKTPKSINAALKAHLEIRRCRPIGKNGKEIPNRLLIHAGDWTRFKKTKQGVDPLDLPSDVVDAAIEAAGLHEEIRKKKGESRK